MTGEKIVSTVAFKSNLQIVTEPSISEDRHFLSCVRDPFGLKIMREKMMRLTAIQEEEYDNASLHCVYAPEDDYPFGTIIDAGGRECVVCRCTNTRCRNFRKCRPDFDPAGLDAVSSNALFRAAAAEMVACAHRQGNTGRDTGNERAAGLLYAGRGEDEQGENTDFPEPALAETVSTGARGEQAPVSGGRDNADVSTETNADATFESFRTVEQADIIRLAPEERTIVNAGPGTGKTWTLIEKIKYMLGELGISPEEILVLCFSRAAVEVVRSRLQAAAGNNELPPDWHQVDVRSFDSFATYMLAWLMENMPELIPEEYTLEARSYDERIADATEVLKTEGILDSYRHVIIDEVQDLVGVRAEMVLALLGILPADCGFTLLGDSCQALYDYLSDKDPGVMSSECFYRTLFHAYPQAEYLSLERNYRQGNELGETTLPYREAILTGTPESRSREAASLDSMIPTADVDLKHFTAAAAREYTRYGTLGILTRSNGQALQISSWLRTQGIEHNLKRPAQASGLGAWLAAVFGEAETDVMDFPEFKAIFQRLYPRADAGLFWNAVLSTQTETSKRHYEIEALLRGLIRNPRNPLLFNEPGGISAPVTVSNVHRSKGREYDTVLVLEDIVKDMCHAGPEKQLDHRVCYVALTRPKKKIEKLKLDTQHIYISKDEERRCYRSGKGRGGGKYLSHYEVGFDADLEQRSFAASLEVQRYLPEALARGDRLKLLKCPENPGRYAVYRIVPEETPHMVLGYTTAEFARGMERAIQRIFKNPRPVAYRYFPRIFRDLYVDGLTSCVSARGENLPGARKFGNMYIWNGIRVSGFAQMEKDWY